MAATPAATVAEANAPSHEEAPTEPMEGRKSALGDLGLVSTEKEEPAWDGTSDCREPAWEE
eukprot:6508947-Heterocapsa_arctica.AAC.1